MRKRLLQGLIVVAYGLIIVGAIMLGGTGGGLVAAGSCFIISVLDVWTDD